MLALISADLFPIGLAFAIGIATGWWVWARLPARPSAHALMGAPARTATPIRPVATFKPPPPAPVAPAPASNGAEKPRTSNGSGSTAVGPEAGPAIETAAAAARPKIAPAVGAPDDLQRIKGIGPKLSALCHSLGVSRFDQIAQWTPADVAEVDHHLDGFRGRIERDHWIEQAQLLAAGDIALLEAKFGKKEGHDHDGA